MTRLTNGRARGRAGITLVAGALAAVAAVGPAAATQILTADGTGNGVTDTWYFDDNDDGLLDRVLIDANENGLADAVAATRGGLILSVWLDTNGDAVYDAALVPYYAPGTSSVMARVLWRDVDQNARWENAYYDGQLDPHYEWVLVDTNYDGSADTWAWNVAPRGHGAADEAARQVAAVGAFQILVGGNVPIFGPLAWPVGG